MWTLALAAVAACGDDPADPLSGRHTVVIVTVDTLRADAVGAGRGTPSFKRFFASATRFAGARTVAPLTVPAHASLFSGLLPPAHGISDNSTAGLARERGFPLLAEEFRKAGFATAAFVSCSVLGPHTGLDAGFDVYHCPAGDPATFAEVPAAVTVERASAWLRRAQGPAFLWVHLFDPHRPYAERPPHAPGPPAKGPAMHRAEIGRYYGEVARVDAALGSLLEAVPDDAVVVLASDHGEGLWDHGEPTHGTECWSSTIDALLAVRSPVLEAGAVDRAPRSLVDVAPTLRRWCSLPEAAHDGRALYEDGDRVVVSEAISAWRRFGWGQVFSATDGRFTLVESGPRVEIYDRESDPDETRPMHGAADHDAYERLDRAIEAYRTSEQRRETRPVAWENSTPYGQLTLPNASYLPRAANARLVDPNTRYGMLKDMLAAEQAAQLGAARGDGELLLRATETYERLEQRDPGNPTFHWDAYQAKAALADLVREPAARRVWSRRAAVSALAALRAGLRHAPVLEAACQQALAAGEHPLMQAAFEAALRRDVAPSLGCAEGVAELARALRPEYGDKSIAEATAYLAWAGTAVDDEGERRRVASLVRLFETSAGRGG